MTARAASAKPPAPLLTRVVQLLGFVAFVLGALIFADVVYGCSGLDCFAWAFVIYLWAWGTVAALSGVRNRIGLACLLLALLGLFLASWAIPLAGIVALGLLLFFTGVSKERLRPYYLDKADG